MFVALISRGTAVRLLPRNEEFFDLFTEVANRNKEAAQHLSNLFAAAPDRRTPHVQALKRLEHEADQVTHEVVNRLDRTFITPLDREDIHQLASDLDDVMEPMRDAGRDEHERRQEDPRGRHQSARGTAQDVTDEGRRGEDRPWRYRMECGRSRGGTRGPCSRCRSRT